MVSMRIREDLYQEIKRKGYKMAYILKCGFDAIEGSQKINNEYVEKVAKLSIQMDTQNRKIERLERENRQLIAKATGAQI